MSWAIFVGDDLDACTDLAVDQAPGGPEEAEKFAARSAGTPGGQRLSKPCAEQFSDRAVLATCAVGVRKEGRAALTISAYNLRTLESDDVYMRQCLAMAGDWRPSPQAVERARNRDARRLLDRLIANQ